MPKMTLPPTLTERELTIILAALRMAQEETEVLNAMPHMMDESASATAEEIEEICQKVNTPFGM
jgi:hypothetical protein